ncbi:Acyl-CoA synthetase (AMP-forming)/AMP-acid ligase II [Thermomonospora echinospora]|uniref:Acyl-CoA synthetase (AMP-forming)/AMP-acid ligase II n=1 Tax=Thermomonospora echinospora TaxID=1992 RepID=A0A1H5T1G4_9ACTN|nr:AMP-binding protein [Thermomonospora echinospora]SEF56640.1 Acyl-CoA synthetase (AMP-forming)/AMP-acid ligase II [Thermomonospora echinospora]
MTVGNPTLGSLFETVLGEASEAEAIIDGPVRLTFGDWWRRSGIAAAALSALGVRAGDLVCLVLPSSADFAVCHLAAMRLNAIVTAANPRLGATEIAHILGRTEPAMIVTDEPDRIAAGPATAVRTPADLLRGHRSLEGAVTPAPGDPAVIVWTTGTTGTPKGAWFDHESLLVMAHNMGPLSAPGDRKLMPVPFAHAAFMTRIYDQLLYRSALILTPREWSARGMLDLMVRERVTVGQGVPTQWEKLIALDELAGADLSSLRLASTGAGRVPPPLVLAMRERLGCPVVVRYASTEVPLCFGTGLDDPPELVASTVGRPLGDVEAQVRDDAGRPLGPGRTGLVHLRSRGSMRGYWREPGLTAETMSPDGWIATSDVGSLDGGGNLTIVGRADDAYIRGGYNVHPSEVEPVLLAHPRIGRATVVGAPAPVIGEVGVAFAVPTGDGPLPSAEEIRAWCRGRIADYKAPDIMVWVDDLPVNATYKIDRTALRRRAEREAARRAAARPRGARPGG